MLSQWCIGSKSIRKQIAWRWYQFGDLQNALRIHATSAAEAADVAALGVTTAVTVVPNGCDMPPDRLTLATSMLTPDSRWVVSIGRIHPVKRFAELIEAWDRVRPDGWRLLIAGPDEIGHAADLKVQIARLGLTSSVSLRGAVSTQEKWQLLAEADLFALASHSENFGMAIAEALASGTPVLATTGTPWNEINREGCGWWVPPSPDELAEGLRRALQTPTSELQAMGQRGQSLIVRQYAWDRQARETLKMYLP
jgi:glycosyltransferase involved in cell wall biosynthesis